MEQKSAMPASPVGHSSSVVRRLSSGVRRLSSVVRRRSSDGPKLINLALQGGGAHGAFTWGVLDRLLEDGRFAIAGISGTSAGAMNAVMLADGLARGGPEEGRKRLAEFWRAASVDGDLPGMQRTVIDRLFSFLPFETSPAQIWVNALSRFLSPYDLNPLNINPLKDLIERFVDFDATPTSSQEIMNRMNEITFNSSLLGELRAIEFASRLIDEGRLPRGTGPGQYRRMKLHRISLDRAFPKLDADSKLSSDYDFFVMLRNGGRRAARNFIDAHFHDIGVRSTVDLSAEIRAEWA